MKVKKWSIDQVNYRLLQIIFYSYLGWLIGLALSYVPWLEPGASLVSKTLGLIGALAIGIICLINLRRPGAKSEDKATNTEDQLRRFTDYCFSSHPYALTEAQKSLTTKITRWQMDRDRRLEVLQSDFDIEARALLREVQALDEDRPVDAKILNWKPAA